MQWWKLRRRVHSSWLLATASCGVVMGVTLAQSVSDINGVGWLLCALSLIAVISWRRAAYLLPLIIVAGGIVGLWRGSLDQTQLAVYKNLYNAQIVIRGKVADDPDMGKGGQMVLRINNISADGHTLIGKVWVTTAAGKDIKRGDIVTIKGKLSKGFGNFAGTMYRAQLVMHQRPQPGDVARQVRDWFADSIRTAIPDPQASLGIGYLVGQKRALPPDLSEALQIAGLTHIVVASGYNLTILVRLARRLFVSVSKYLAALSASAMIAAFIAVTGASPSMSRAGLVAGLSLAAWYYGRKFHPLVLLPLAAAVTVLIDPSFAWNDLGWQLSFAAFAGVMIMAPLLQRYFYGDVKPGLIRQILGETISAFIVTLPILVYAFGQFSNVAVLANLLVLPLVPLAMLLTFIAGVGALVVPFAAATIGIPAYWLLTYMTTVTYHVADLPWALTELEMSEWMVVVGYVGIAGFCVYMWRKTNYNLRESNIVE